MFYPLKSFAAFQILVRLSLLTTNTMTYVCRSDCTVGPVEARAAAASRRASRANTRESSVVPIEEIGRNMH